MKNLLKLIIITLIPVSYQANASVDEAFIASCSVPKYKNLMPMIVRKESMNNPYAVNINAEVKIQKQPGSLERAMSIVKMLKNSEFNFDVGLSQVNSYHFRPGGFLSKKNFTVEDALDPCLNVLMGSLILDDAVRMAKGNLGQALSIYNTGHKEYGFRNGYVDRVLIDN